MRAGYQPGPPLEQRPPRAGPGPAASSASAAAPIPEVMPPSEPSCPLCDADLVLAGDERSGDRVFCTYCGAPFVLTARKDDESGWDVEEDE